MPACQDDLVGMDVLLQHVIVVTSARLARGGVELSSLQDPMPDASRTTYITALIAQPSRMASLSAAGS